MEDPYTNPDAIFETVDQSDPDVTAILEQQEDAGVEDGFGTTELQQEEDSGVLLSQSFSLASIADDVEDDAADLNINVSDPQQEGEGVSSFVLYTVGVKTTLQGFGGEVFDVKRRYSDFVWLHGELSGLYPGYIIPPMPETEMFSKFIGKFDSELLKFRARELQKFLRRIARHPTFKNAIPLKEFLESNDEAFLASKNKKSNKQSTIGGWFSSAKSGVSSVVTGAVEEHDELIKAKTEWLNALQVALLSAGKSAHVFIEAEKALKAQLQMMSEAAKVMSAALSIDEGFTQLSKQWGATGEVLTNHHDCVQTLNHQIQVRLEDTIHDYRRFVESCKTALKFRFEKLVAKAGAEKSLEGKKNAKKQKQADIEAAEAALEAATQEFEKYDEIVKEELQRFEALMGNEIKTALKRFATTSSETYAAIADFYAPLKHF